MSIAIRPKRNGGGGGVAFRIIVIESRENREGENYVFKGDL